MNKIILLLSIIFTSVLFAQKPTENLSKDLSTPLCGTYTVGDLSSDYVNLKEAIDSLNACGISCNVIFDIKPGVYSSQFIIDSLHVLSSSDSIEFRSQTGISSDVVITSDSLNFVFKIDSTKHVVFEHLSFTSDSSETLLLNNFSSYTTVIDCKFLGAINTNYGIKSNESTGLNFNNNLFENSDIAIDISQTGQKNKIFSNTFHNQISYSIKLKDQTEYEVYKNNINTLSAVAIDISSSDNGKIKANDIYVDNINTYPFNIGSNYDTTIISNNFIKSKNSNGLIRLSGDKYMFVNNSISANSGGSLINIWGNDNLILNNIFNNKGTGYVAFIWSGSSNNFDYNCYFTYGNFGKFGGTECLTIQDWQTTTSLDLNSINYRPTFVSETDLHTNFSYIDNIGTPVTFDTTDIDDEVRDASNPDIGADEFTSTCTGKLSGIRTIGIAGEFLTFNDAVKALYDCGIDTSVTFSINPGTYNEQIYIDSLIPDLDNADYISFIGQTNSPNDVIVSFDADSVDDNYIFKLDGIDKITIKKLSLTSLDSVYSRQIVIDDIFMDDKFDSLVFNGTTNDSLDYGNLINASSIYLNNLITAGSNNIISNSIFNGNGYALYLKNYYGLNNNYSVLDNTFNNQLEGVLYSLNFNNSIFQNNEISRTVSSVTALDNYSLYVIGCDSFLCNKNKFSINEGKAIEMDSPNSLISNNFIISNNGIRSTNSVKIYNNSIISNSKAIELPNNYDCEIKNNIIVADGQYSLCISSYYNFNNNIISDFNNLYTMNGGRTAEFGLNPSYWTLSDWQNISNQDLNSLATNPSFVSNTDLHTTNVLFDGKAEALASVTEDIDGESRDAANPDIGADEFTEATFTLGADTVSCFNIPIVLDAGNGFDSYLWSTGSDSSTTKIDSLNSVVGNNSYIVTVTASGSTYIDTINVQINRPQAAPQNVYCLNQNVETSVEIFAGDNESYEWAYPYTGTTTQSVLASNNQVYTVTVTDINGCTEVQNINVKKYYGAAILYSDTTICNDDTLYIDAISYTDLAHNTYNINWNTGDTTFTLMVDSSKYAVGNYTFTVEVIALNGCISYDTVDVVIEDCTNVKEIDNNLKFAVYPNPANDILRIEFSNNNLLNSKIDIFDITGKSVYNDKLKYNNQTIDISNIRTGLYFMQINNQTIKLIIE